MSSSRTIALSGPYFQFHQGLSFYWGEKDGGSGSNFQFHQGLSNNVPGYYVISYDKPFNSIKDYPSKSERGSGYRYRKTFNSIKDYQIEVYRYVYPLKRSFQFHQGLSEEKHEWKEPGLFNFQFHQGLSTMHTDMSLNFFQLLSIPSRIINPTPTGSLRDFQVAFNSIKDYHLDHTSLSRLHNICFQFHQGLSFVSVIYDNETVKVFQFHQGLSSMPQELFL